MLAMLSLLSGILCSQRLINKLIYIEKIGWETQANLEMEWKENFLLLNLFVEQIPPDAMALERRGEAWGCVTHHDCGPMGFCEESGNCIDFPMPPNNGFFHSSWQNFLLFKHVFRHDWFFV